VFDAQVKLPVGVTFCDLEKLQKAAKGQWTKRRADDEAEEVLDLHEVITAAIAWLKVTPLFLANTLT
jgi:hypothetical protein